MASSGKTSDLRLASEDRLERGSSKLISLVRLAHTTGVGAILGTHVELWDGKGCKTAAGDDMLLLRADSQDCKMFVDTRRYSRSQYMLNAIVHSVAQSTCA